MIIIIMTEKEKYLKNEYIVLVKLLTFVCTQCNL